MTFLAPIRLFFLLVPGALAVAYLVALRRRSRYVVRFTNLELLDSVAPDRPGWRRNLPATALLAALVLVALAVARPALAVRVPRERATVVLAIDTSLSMKATDVAPSRIAAAQEAALRFVELAPKDLRIGIVAFSGVAVPVQVPTDDRAAVEQAINDLFLAEGTAVGEGVFTALDLATRAPEGEAPPPAAIVVLSDGTTTMGRPDLDAADAAAAAGIKVSTVSFGTDAGTVTIGGEVIPVPVNDGALRDIADRTGGTFYQAASASALQDVLDTVGSQIGFETEEREVTDWFAGAGLLMAALAAAGSIAWFSRLP